MGALKPWHIIIIVVAFLLLFGFKRLPDAARSLGRSMRIFKAETKGLTSDDAPETPSAPAAAAPVVAPAPAPVAVENPPVVPPVPAAPAPAAATERTEG